MLTAVQKQDLGYDSNYLSVPRKAFYCTSMRVRLMMAPCALRTATI